MSSVHDFFLFVLFYRMLNMEEMAVKMFFTILYAMHHLLLQMVKKLEWLLPRMQGVHKP